jgi:hypothetical protein
MHIRRSPVALTLVALVAVLLLAGTALGLQSGLGNLGGISLSANGASKSPKAADASEAPEASDAPEAPEGSGGPPSADELARIVDKLKAAGITTTASDLSDLAAKVGVGGAVRVLAFAHARGKTPAEILAMFQSGKGWGEIDHELGLSVGPGIGWIMGNGGNGPTASGG